MLNKIDPIAMKILKKYNILAEGYIARGYPLDAKKMKYVEEYSISADERNYLKNKGLGFDFVEITHDEALDKAFGYFKTIKKNHVTSLFLSGLSTGRLDYRSTLPAFAIMQTMPQHEFIPTEALFCEVCCGMEKETNLDLTGLNRDRFFSGSFVSSITPFEIFFFLKQSLSLDVIEPIECDFIIFNSILDILSEADSGEKLASIVKKIKKIENFKISTDQCKCLLETLGYCSILETQNHKGYLTIFTNPGLSPSKSHSSNWAYPVDFWVGGEGINREALRYWFGQYKSIHI